MEGLLKVELNYKKFVEYIQTDPIGLSLNIPASTKLDELNSSLLDRVSQIRSRFDSAFEFIDRSASCQEASSTFDAGKEIHECLKELQFIAGLPNCSAALPHNLIKKLEELVVGKKAGLEREMDFLLNCEQLKKLSDKLVVCQALATACPDSFSDLYEKYSRLVLI